MPNCPLGFYCLEEFSEPQDTVQQWKTLLSCSQIAHGMHKLAERSVSKLLL